MRKNLSLFLALLIVLSLCITAFAYDGSTEITIEVPENKAIYTFNYPANASLVYGENNPRMLGTLSVRELQYCKTVTARCTATDLINVNDPTDTIAVAWSPDLSDPLKLCDEGVYGDRQLYARVDDWSGATPGARYEATVSYVIECE